MADVAATPHFHTYHCLCTELILATTLELASLPRRAPPALDKAIILPVVATSILGDDIGSQDQASSVQNGPQNDSRETSREDYGHSVLASIVVDRKPTIVRREDGFDKRTLVRCQRCKLVIGYKLDDSQFGTGGSIRDMAGRVFDIYFVLPGALVKTEEMKRGETPREGPWETAFA